MVQGQVGDNHKFIDYVKLMSVYEYFQRLVRMIGVPRESLIYRVKGLGCYG